MKILVIEDEKLLADSIKEMLERKGFQVEAVYDGEAGILFAQKGGRETLCCRSAEKLQFHGKTLLFNRLLLFCRLPECGNSSRGGACPPHRLPKAPCAEGSSCGRGWRD